MSEPLRVVHYLNQLFAGIGAEEKANVGPQSRDGFIGPGQAVQKALRNQGKVVGTLICGDNYFAERTAEATQELLQLLIPYGADMLIAGPAFNAGRYGIACGELCKVVQENLNIPAVTGMYDENPGVDLYKKYVYIVKSASSVLGMAETVSLMVNLACKLATKQNIGKPSEEGYFPQGIFTNELSDKIAAKRAVDMLLDKIKNKPFKSEVEPFKFDRVKPAAAVGNLISGKLALITDGGLVPKGNPDNLESRMATRFGSYSIAGLHALTSENYEANHLGYDTSFVNQDPHRLLPLDVMRDLEKEGLIGNLHEAFYSTAGVSTTIENATKIGKNIANQLIAEGVTAIIQTST